VSTGNPAPAGGGTGATNPSGAAVPTGSRDGYSISSTALSLRGAPYRNGGADPTGFDCSGFVRYVFAQHGISMPRDVRQQFERGEDVDPATLEPGDLLFFTTVAPGASHVGISVGGDQFVHAPSSNGVVRVENLSHPYWANRFVGAKRVD
jgi:cell wall-associated NlpC family hydrolase